MYSYIPPIDDYRFLLNMLDFDAEMAGIGKDVDADLAAAVLEEAGRMCADRLHPLNREGDEQGSKLVDGTVQTPHGFAEAWRDFARTGWTSLSAAPEYGGQGLPFILQLWLDEMVSATNLSFGLFPGLTRGACEAIMAHACDELKSTYLPRMVSGEWTGSRTANCSARPVRKTVPGSSGRIAIAIRNRSINLSQSIAVAAELGFRVVSSRQVEFCPNCCPDRHDIPPRIADGIKHRTSHR